MCRPLTRLTANSDLLARIMEEVQENDACQTSERSIGGDSEDLATLSVILAFALGSFTVTADAANFEAQPAWEAVPESNLGTSEAEAPQESTPTDDDSCFRLIGIIITFSNWPPTSEIETLILRELRKAGYRRESTFPRSMSWEVDPDHHSDVCRGVGDTCSRLMLHECIGSELEACAPDNPIMVIPMTYLDSFFIGHSMR